MAITVDEIQADISRLRKMQSERARNIGVLEAGIDRREKQLRELRFLLKAGGHQYNDEALHNNVSSFELDVENIRAAIRKEEAGIEQCGQMIAVLEEKVKCLSATT